MLLKDSAQLAVFVQRGLHWPGVGVARFRGPLAAVVKKVRQWHCSGRQSARHAASARDRSVLEQEPHRVGAVGRCWREVRSDRILAISDGICRDGEPFEQQHRHVLNASRFVSSCLGLRSTCLLHDELARSRGSSSKFLQVTVLYKGAVLGRFVMPWCPPRCQPCQPCQPDTSHAHRLGPLQGSVVRSMGPSSGTLPEGTLE